MRVLIIGLGSIGRKHVVALNQLNSNIEIFALRSLSSFDTYLNVKNIYNLNNISEISFAIVSNPTSEHKKTIELLKEYNIPMFIEKPICSDLDIVELINLIETKKIKTYIACNLRFLDSIKYVKEKLNNKTQRLNEVNVYCGSFLPNWRANEDFRDSYSARAELGGGVHLDLIHELDYIYWLFGSPKKVNRTFRNQSTLGISSYDYANYILDYDGFCTSVVLNYYRRDPKRILELVFEDETWNVDLLKNQILCNNQLIFSSEQNIADTYISQMKYFIDSFNVANGTFNTISNAYEVLKICLPK